MFGNHGATQRSGSNVHGASGAGDGFLDVFRGRDRTARPRYERGEGDGERDLEVGRGGGDGAGAGYGVGDGVGFAKREMRGEKLGDWFGTAREEVKGETGENWKFGAAREDVKSFFEAVNDIKASELDGLGIFLTDEKAAMAQKTPIRAAKPSRTARSVTFAESADVYKYDPDYVGCAIHLVRSISPPHERQRLQSHNLQTWCALPAKPVASNVSPNVPLPESQV
ncbi:hypothetical protein M7I_5094 [Glarea lozoyensis 74030]|uniref:Uncharacterized protein n=1 Tax=Glarea lozoyensis (strain ATCC 74030 / MF5533) TaxID=1104152 RepID=H0EQY5_GLAL7|nr:hypothetical protein M7I_5094 [Glarea lozoyensis 74030]